jgi:leader peptidase (prepilin peptidase) / N-methyltransferase
VGTIQAVGISVAAGISAGVVGWWSYTNPVLQRWVEEANKCPPSADGHAAQTLSLSRSAWPAGSSAAAAFVALTLLLGRTTSLWLVPFLVVWASGLALLALIDQETLVLPTKLIRICALVVGSLLVEAASVTRDWAYLGRGVLCALLALAGYGAWAFWRPNSLGLGDARMACLVAFGAGSVSPAACMVALTCAPLAAATVSVFRRSPAALGPFLALAGLTVVAASAI